VKVKIRNEPKFFDEESNPNNYDNSAEERFITAGGVSVIVSGHFYLFVFVKV
jgi:hypothetical protein